jgi:hypothetical protein
MGEYHYLGWFRGRILLCLYVQPVIGSLFRIMRRICVYLSNSIFRTFLFLCKYLIASSDTLDSGDFSRFDPLCINRNLWCVRDDLSIVALYNTDGKLSKLFSRDFHPTKEDPHPHDEDLAERFLHVEGSVFIIDLLSTGGIMEQMDEYSVITL